MTVRSRLKRLGVDGRPRSECPACGGKGRMHDPFGAHGMWIVEQRVARLRAELAGVAHVPSPAPDEPMKPCPTCNGAGEVGDRVVGLHEAGSREGAARLDQMLSGIMRHRELRAAANERNSGSDENRSPLRAVSSDDGLSPY